MKYLLEATEEYINSGKGGDPNGKFTLNQFRDIVKIAEKKEHNDLIAAVKEKRDNDVDYYEDWTMGI